jgi:hypothetical protein
MGKADSRAVAIKKILNSSTDFDAKKLAKIQNLLVQYYGETDENFESRIELEAQ